MSSECDNLRKENAELKLALEQCKLGKTDNIASVAATAGNLVAKLASAPASPSTVKVSSPQQVSNSVAPDIAPATSIQENPKSANSQKY
jgi:hypothetical protein